MILVDDRLLRTMLMAQEPDSLVRLRRHGPAATTSCWLYRLCQAVIDPSIAGTLSGPITAMPPTTRDEVVTRIARLPPEVERVSWREIAWSMADLVQRHRLNLLALEALAAALNAERYNEYVAQIEDLDLQDQ